MAYSVDWFTGVVTVPKADTSLVSAGPPEVRQLDVEDLWRELRRIEATELGVVFPGTLFNPDGMVRHQPPLTVAGITLGRVVEVINGFTLEFEDGQYSVNIVGGNSNVADVRVPNNVSVNTANSAGFAVAPGQDLSDLLAIHKHRRVVDPATGVETVYESDDVTPRFSRTVYESPDGAQKYRGRGFERVDRFQP